MKLVRTLIISSFIVTSGLAAGSSVLAQAPEALVESPVATASTAEQQPGTEPVVFAKPALETEIETVEKSYQGQLETYRTAANKYQIAKQQYVQLQTLTSLESAVTSTREAMLARNEVLLSYLTLMKLNLIQATGVNLTQKDPTLAKLETTHQWLLQHQEQVKLAADRYQILEVANAFSLQQPSITAVSYQTLSLLAVGKLQTVYDKTLALSQEVETEVVIAKQDVKQEERRRALVEIKRELTEVQSQFSTINAEVENDRADFSRGFYSRVQGDLGTIYSQLSQTLSHLSELVRL